ncbi:phage tail protein [Cloacibacillus evryensis]|jgi:microcystin-dependent protein|uniref:Phage tail protein n=1 Tax=Cloacibacillus evryensis TaxID=508460 RepID=A0AAW5K0B2_9BACT|nr:tail fiber protein [Cloacibacillus evryensis]EHL68474.1 hypothetical protein HMPREF1006_02497 [Synergistes sp. 3_1_syn1]MCQ4814260.1 phage tail protein [Cloacibacillus evryensis]
MSCFEIFGKGGKRIASGHVGEIKFFPVDTPPAHTLVCNGAELSIAAYPELYGVIGTKYGGNGSTTFKLPAAEDVIYAAGSKHAVGEVIVEGLPDISGTFVSLTASTTGAFATGDLSGYNCAAGGHDFYRKSFHASGANAIYGASAHVTPAGIALLACIVYE